MLFLLALTLSTLRDPFFLPKGPSHVKPKKTVTVRSKRTKIKKSNPKPMGGKGRSRVLGIVEVDGARRALVKVGGVTKRVKVGDKIGRYTIAKIKEQRILVKTVNGEEIWSM